MMRPGFIQDFHNLQRQWDDEAATELAELIPVERPSAPRVIALALLIVLVGYIGAAWLVMFR